MRPTGGCAPAETRVCQPSSGVDAGPAVVLCEIAEPEHSFLTHALMAEEFDAACGWQFCVVDAGHDFGGEVRSVRLEGKERLQRRLHVVQAEDAATVYAAGRIGESGGGCGQIACRQFCGPVGAAEVDGLGGRDGAGVGAGEGETGRVLFVGDDGAEVGEGEGVSADAATEIEDRAGLGVAVDPLGAVQCDGPGSCLLQGLGGEEHAPGVGEFRFGAQAQAGEGEERTGLLGRERLPQAVERGDGLVGLEVVWRQSGDGLLRGIREEEIDDWGRQRFGRRHGFFRGWAKTDSKLGSRILTGDYRVQ